MRHPLRKLLIGAGTVAGLAVLTALPASAGDTGMRYPNYDTCMDVADTIRDSQTGADCLFDRGDFTWHLYTYG
ncbi:hypothetical protein OG474_33585 [Kribbella sp. NBC_01505]|uniref:hypothetical protein n=1 Tax=Kribbella sp. NBC_01505 TaxID=2903580 RepID=UPI0038664F76